MDNSKTGSANDESFREPLTDSFEESDNEERSKADCPAESHQRTIASTETKTVLRLKLVVALVLLASTVAVATTVFSYLKSSQESQFLNQFDEDCNKILSAVGISLDKTFGLFDSVSVTMVSAARMTNQTWPFVTIPDFAVRMAKLLPQTDAININILPIVTRAERKEWEEYTLAHNSWVDATMTVQSVWEGYHGPVGKDRERGGSINGDFGEIPYNTSRHLLPVWQNFPVIPNSTWTYNYDWLSVSFPESYEACIQNRQITMSKPYMIPSPGDPVAEAETRLWAETLRAFISPEEEPMEPVCDVSYPIINDVSELRVAGSNAYSSDKHKIVGIVGATMYYRTLIRDILPKGSNGINIVFTNPCTESFTYQINGPSVEYLGVGDHHDHSYDTYGVHQKLYDLADQQDSLYSGAKPYVDFCPISLHIYPSSIMESEYSTHDPGLFTFAAVLIFLFTSLVFYLYDVSVERRQRTVMSSAERSSAIISSLFPAAVRDRLYPEIKNATPEDANRTSLHPFLRHGNGSAGKSVNGSTAGTSGSPIAELYPETTVLFADICGFTAWSSTRQPSQVFHLLETLYAEFDEIAKRRGVFKVETIGDSYVAVVGLPMPRKHHAVVMVRFAYDCLNVMNVTMKRLETSLGPGTADLTLRCGLNSGPTTAGVLRGEKSRFQLFGDTVNTTARMESSGMSNKIHVSLKTAELIKTAGKCHWLTLREEQVHCKGKGMMTTYWCDPKREVGSVHLSEQSDDFVNRVCGSEIAAIPDLLHTRLVNWNVDLFSGLIRNIVRCRNAVRTFHRDNSNLGLAHQKPVDEIATILAFPRKSSRVHITGIDNVKIENSVLLQLQELVLSISQLYPKSNAFHNFDHCCHVVMSTKKLLDRIVENQENAACAPSIHEKQVREKLSDPLTQLAIIFSALIHDVDHYGISNSQLVNERHPVAMEYSGQSVLEQNSIDTTWKLLMQPQFSELRACIFSDESEMKWFRQIVVNAVLATDLFDNDLKAMRESRWEMAFSGTKKIHGMSAHAKVNCHATIIVEKIIQASDVSHTMQHFTIYKKWNMKLLTEMYTAYKSGRSAKDPTDGWYEGELWFFDNYVIPLANKLRACGVFGVSCDEFLNYAQDNRLEWEMKGREIVEEAKRTLLDLNVARIEL